MDNQLICGHPITPLHDLVDGLLQGPARRAVEMQIVECAICREHHAGLADMLADFALLEPVSPPIGLAAATMRAIRADRRRRSPIQLIAAMVASMVIVGGVALTFSPAETAAEPTAVSYSPSIVVSIDDPTGAGLEADGIMISGLCLALGGSAFLLSRLIQPQAA